MLQREVHLSKSGDSSDEEVVEKPPSAIALPSFRMLPKEVHLSESEDSSDEEVVEKPPSAIALPSFRLSKHSLETQKKHLLLPPTLLPKSAAPPAAKSSKVAQERPTNERSQLPALDNSARSKKSCKDPSISKHRKVKRNHSELCKSIKGSAGDVPKCSCRPRKVHLKAEIFRKHLVEYYAEEIKRLKHKADAMTNNTGKAIQYLDAALCFIEYGMALESDAPAPKSASSVFRDTIKLLKLITTMKSFLDSSSSSHEKILLVLSMRCQSVLHMAMLRHKRDTVKRYCRILSNHFESSSRATPAPYASVASFSADRIGSSVMVPTHIPEIAYSYVKITSSILHACELWQEAEALARTNKDFFAELSTTTCTLALNSSVRQLVYYARQGLERLRLETNTP